MTTPVTYSRQEGSCNPGPQPTPLAIHNRAGLSDIRYRIATFASAQEAMVRAAARDSRLSEWTGRTPVDYGMVFFGMWAAIGDVLSFYQERIANEAFLPTAVHRASVMRLAQLLGYQPAAGLAAQTHLALEIEDGKCVQIPVGLRVQSVPAPGEKPQKFGTLEELDARSEWNVLSPRLDDPLSIGRGSLSLYLDGVDTRLQPGDAILIVGDEKRNDPASERWDLRILSSVEENPSTRRTLVTWEPELGHGKPAIDPPANPQVYALRQRASLFGHNAPEWKAMPDEIKKAYCDKDPWTRCKQWPQFEVAEGDTIHLDAVYTKIVPDSWIVLSKPGYREAYGVTQSEIASRTGYTLTSKVSRLTLDGFEHLTWFSRRHTVVYAQSEQLTPLPPPRTTPIAGSSVELDRPVAGLLKGKSLILQGTRTDTGETDAELATIDNVSATDTHTAIRFSNPLTSSYEIGSVKIYANAVPVGHGETIRDEILGSGDASVPLQRFELEKTPVTRVPDATAPGGGANTLTVRVDNVAWSERESLYGAEGNDRVYTTHVDDDETMAVQLGDGKYGACLVTGRNNLVASYRQGLGPDGNVGRNALKTLLDRPNGLKSSNNPLPATGGASSDTRDMTRSKAPSSVKIFDRIVSIQDFADAARSYAGIAKAHATRERAGEQERVLLVVAGDGGEEASAAVRSDLRAYLDARRDPNRQLRIACHVPVDIEVAGVVQANPAYDADNVCEAAISAILAHFAFDHRELGQPVHLGDMYRALQSVEGVTAIRIDRFRFKPVPPIEAESEPDPVPAETKAGDAAAILDRAPGYLSPTILAPRLVDPALRVPDGLSFTWRPTPRLDGIIVAPLRMPQHTMALPGQLLFTIPSDIARSLASRPDHQVAADSPQELYWRLPIASDELAILTRENLSLTSGEVSS